MNKRKAVLMVVAAVSVLALCGMFFLNDLILLGMVNGLKSAVKKNPQVQLVETQSVCGKINGNGNGIQYFGAVLIKSDDETAVKALLEELKGEYDEVGYCVQAGQNIRSSYLEHQTLSYDHDSFQDATYYSIYFYNSHCNLSNPLDLRGY